MLIPSSEPIEFVSPSSLSRRVNANSQQTHEFMYTYHKLIKKGEC